MPQIGREYVDTGKMKHFFMDFPLAMHQNAQKAAEAANCAADQEKFWQMHDRFFANQNALGKDNLSIHAEALRLDMPKFRECLNSGKYSDKVKKETAEGQKAGITGTPTFLLGFIQSDGKVKAVRKIVGAQQFNTFKSAIDEMLSAKK
jgi:protein-disulfide isomerase